MQASISSSTRISGALAPAGPALLRRDRISADLIAFKNREGAKIVVYAYGERDAAKLVRAQERHYRHLLDKCSRFNDTASERNERIEHLQKFKKQLAVERKKFRELAELRRGAYRDEIPAASYLPRAVRADLCEMSLLSD